jgi:Ca2+-binding RTX toxin-like protein
MSGAAGNDVYVVDDAGDTITEAAGSGTDTVRTTLASYSLGSDANAALENLIFVGTGAFAGTGNALANALTGASGDDLLYGGDGADTLTGNAGADILDGGSAIDRMIGGLGDDFYFVDDASDVVTEVAGQGSDTVTSSASYELKGNIENLILVGAVNGTGNSEANTITGSDLANTIRGAVGNDTLFGGAGDDDLRGGNLSDSLMGGDGNDTLQGGDTNDFDPVTDAQHGNDGNDVLDGGAGNDILAGGANNDLLVGGEGFDTLQGGSGKDTLTGGAGADSFIFAALSDGGDLIADFEQGADTIDLSRIDARSDTLTFNDAFGFAGVSGSAVPYSVTYVQRTGTTVISIDVNGDTTAEMTLTLQGTYSLSADDFVL